MLPFTKRPNRPEDADVVDSGEIDVVRSMPSSVPPPSYVKPRLTAPPVSQRYPAQHTATHPVPHPAPHPAPPSERPRVFQRSIDEEMTTVMPSKRGSSFPPASSHAPRSSTRPRAGREDEERTMLRPMTPAQSFSPRPSTSTRTVPPPPSSRPAAFVPPPPPMPNGFGLHVNTPPTMLGQTAIPQSVRAQALAAVRAHQSGQVPAYSPSPPPSSTIPPAPPSDPAINPPATVITTRTRVLIGRPTMSWAAALLAMGVFVGLVTAVVARGDADSLIDATASFVDPAHSTARAAAAQPAAPAPLPAAAPIAPPVVAPIAPPAPLPVALVPAPINPPAPIAAAPAAAPLPPIPLTDSKSDATKTVATNDLPTANATPDKKPPVAYAAPPVAKAAPRYYAPRPAPEPRVAAAPRPAPVPRARKVSASDDDNNAAAAADKLAREQLESALK